MLHMRSRASWDCWLRCTDVITNDLLLRRTAISSDRFYAVERNFFPSFAFRVRSALERIIFTIYIRVTARVVVRQWVRT